MDIIERYRKMREDWLLSGKPLKDINKNGERCEHCGSLRESDKYRPTQCAICGATLPEVKPVYGRIFGINITDEDDYDEIMSNERVLSSLPLFADGEMANLA